MRLLASVWGCTIDGGIEKNSPSNCTGSGPQHARRALDEFVHPPPAGRELDVHLVVLVLRPADAQTHDDPATARGGRASPRRCASSTGRWYPPTRMPVPSTTRSVQAAAALSSSSGDIVDR